MRRYAILIIILLASCHHELQSQDIWPGDVNSNGEVSAVDLLYWGVAFGSQGPARATVNSAWMPFPIDTLWGQEFPSGLNYAYADCDGNGMVDKNDFDDAIEDNFGLMQGVVGPDFYANAAPGAAPRIKLQPSATLVGEGAMVNIGLSLQPGSVPVADFYGIALKVSYSTGLLNDDDGPDFDLIEDSWIESDGSFIQSMYVDEDGQGQAQLAITRTNQVSVPAQGDEIGQFSIIVEDIIVGLEVDTFIIRVDSVLLIGPDLMAVPTTPDTALIVIARDTSKITSALNPLQSDPLVPIVRPYPNPGRGQLYLQSNVEIRAAQWCNLLGQVWPASLRPYERGHYELEVPNLPPGSYVLRLETDVGVLTRKVMRLGG